MQQEVIYAKFHQRLIARLIDLAIVSLPLSLAMLFSVVYLKSFALAVLFSFLEAAYKPLAEAIFGYTIGKRVRRLRVVRQGDFAPIDLNQSLLRFLPWATIFFASVFILHRHLNDPGMADVNSVEAYLLFSQQHVLADNLVIALINYLPLFSVIWIFSDPMQRALHDRVAGTVVLVNA
ncbi:RDD family protein [Neolewinella lacunae]|uniref:RDD family protein n=1 Tax=Neolewinella lacunae TaxID=1517758 RepID=A0A923PLZ3_9BACT|nr:RDD family protein [Neolewinella lacunae]MBC6992962.1 RDD family protein [Neolewinella lacunae]MDN3633899.1 RDD family protein [Neolewinella lacunae]